jgi:hypothetical protein
MATTVVRVDALLGLDGRAVPAEARAQGERIGRRLTAGINRRLRDIGSGIRSSPALDRLADRLGQRFGGRFMDRIGTSMRSLGNRLRTAVSGFRDLDFSLGKLNDRWRDLSANTRQWTAIIGAVIASMPELAGLSSAAGSGLFILAGAAASVVTGFGALIAGLVVFMGDIEKMPAQLRPARAALDELKDVFKELGDAIAISSFEGTEGAWRSLGATVRGLIPAFETIGKVINQLTRDLAEELKPGTETYEDLYYFVSRSAKIFDRVVRSVGRLGRALLTAFNNPTFQRGIDGLLDYLDTLMTRFEDFVESDGFDEWIEHGISVFGAFGRLLDTAGRLLNNLVTDESIGRLVDFIDNIDRFLQGGGAGILEFFDQLNLFGLLSQILADIGDALEPLRGPMADFAGALRDILSTGIDLLAPILEAVAEALAPLVQGLADFMDENPQAIATGLVAITTAILGMKLISGVGGIIQGFIGKMDDLVRKAPTWKTGLTGFASGIIASLTTITSDDQVTLDNFATNIVTAMLLGFTVGGGPFGALVAGLTAFVATAIKDALDGGSYALDQFAFKEGDPIYDLVEGWGGMLTTFRDETLPAWGAGFTQTWNGFLAQIQGGTGGWLDQIVVRWGETLEQIKTNVTTWWEGLVSGWNGFWLNVNNLVRIGWSWITSGFTQGILQIRLNWNSFWASLGAIVSSAWNSVVSAVAGGINGIISQLNRAKKPIDDFLAALSKLTGGAINIRIPNIPQLPRFGSGGITNGPSIAGEDGPELIIPLRRPLGMVNPEVREISRVLQEGDSSTDNRTQVNFEAGSVVVMEADDAHYTANEVVERIFERAAG